MNPYVPDDLASFRIRAQGQYLRIDPAAALRAVGRRHEVHPNDCWATVWRDADLAEESAEGNRVHFGHRVWGPVMVDGGLLVVLDLTKALRERGLAVTNPKLPDGWRRSCCTYRYPDGSRCLTETGLKADRCRRHVDV